MSEPNSSIKSRSDAPVRGQARSFVMPALLFLAVVLVFLPSLRNGFIDYDDAPFVTANPQVQSGLNWSSLACAFCRPVAANWHPLTTLSHMADCQIYGLNPWGHHLTNVLLHAASTVSVEREHDQHVRVDDDAQ